MQSHLFENTLGQIKRNKRFTLTLEELEMNIVFFFNGLTIKNEHFQTHDTNIL